MESLLKNKKGYSLDDFRIIIVTLLIIGVLAGIGIYTLLEMRFQIDDAITETITNYSSGTVVNDTVLTTIFIGNYTQRDCSFTVREVTYNGSKSMDSLNYTVSGCTIAYSGAEGDGTNNTYWNITGECSYNVDSESAAAVMNTTGASNDLLTWLPIIVVVIAAAIVIFIVINRFAGVS